MASAAIFLTIIIPIAIASGFRIESTQPIKTDQFQRPAVPVVDYRTQPIAGYPKSPPPNAHESGGSDDDLLPPFEHKGPFIRRSIELDPKTGYPLVAEPSWKDAGGHAEYLKPPLEDGEQGAVDPKTGYPFQAQPHWKDAGGDGVIIAPPLDDTEENFGRKEKAVDPKTGYPLKANPSWRDAGGDGEILEPPVGDVGSKAGVDPKTGYPLVAEEGWKDAGGDGEILELPLEEPKEAVDPKTGYPLHAQPGWKNAGGDGDIIQPPLKEEEQVDPKTGYPLTAQPEWKNAGGDGDILELPLEESSGNLAIQVRSGGNPQTEAVDPKTGYPLVAQPQWKDAGGDGDILELPLEDQSAILDERDSKPSDKSPTEAVDPKTGYPLVAQPHWKDAGGDGDILELPLEQSNTNVEVQSRAGRVEPSNNPALDPKTGYPLIAQPQWKDAGGDGDILELPLEQTSVTSETQGRSGGIVPDPQAVDPKTGYPLVAQPQWKHAGGDGDILELPLEQPKGTLGVEGRSSATKLPLQEENGNTNPQGQYDEFEVFKLTELQPPPLEKNFPTVFGNSFSTPGPSRKHDFSGVAPLQNQKRNSFIFDQRPVESSYTYIGPENVVVTVTRYLNTDRLLQQKTNSQNIQNNVQKPFSFHGGNEVPIAFFVPVFPETIRNFNKRHS